MPGDRRGHVPVRVNNDVANLAREHRCIAAAVSTSHDDVHALDQAQLTFGNRAVEGVEAIGRNVDHHNPGGVDVRQPAPSLHRQFDLHDPFGERRPQLRDGSRSEPSVRRETMSPLEVLHAFDQCSTSRTWPPSSLSTIQHRFMI